MLVLVPRPTNRNDDPVFYVCPAEGHVVEGREGEPGEGSSTDLHCPLHGALLFRDCHQCSAPWPTSPTGPKVGPASVCEPAGSCTNCGAPGPWLSRVVLVKAIQYWVRASSSLPLSARIELRAVLERLKSKKQDDPRTIAALRLLRERAPEIWEASKPILLDLAGDAVKKALGGGV